MLAVIEILRFRGRDDADGGGEMIEVLDINVVFMISCT